jgi:hypothetical protein
MTTPTNPKPIRNNMRNKTYFADLLSYSYTQVKASDSSIVSRLNYLGEYVFKFTTYDSEMGEFFAAVALEVATAITDNATPAFIDNSTMHHKWYLAMVNMPFFSGRLEWGCSVRNAWWDHDYYEVGPVGLYEDGEQQLGPLVLTRSEWIEFIKGMLSFAKDELEQLLVFDYKDRPRD